jgi:hypothetical protein
LILSGRIAALHSIPLPKDKGVRIIATHDSTDALSFLMKHQKFKRKSRGKGNSKSRLKT